MTEKDKKLEILRTRTENLSKRLDTREKSEEATLSVIPFKLANEVYGIELGLVNRVHPLSTCVKIPGTPDFLLGITNIEGVLYSVTDLKPFFALPSMGITNFNKLIVLENDNMRFAILADEVMALREINPSSLKHLEKWYGADGRFIRGITTDKLILLNAMELLSADELRLESSKLVSTSNTST